LADVGSIRHNDILYLIPLHIVDFFLLSSHLVTDPVIDHHHITYLQPFIYSLVLLTFDMMLFRVLVNGCSTFDFAQSLNVVESFCSSMGEQGTKNLFSSFTVGSVKGTRTALGSGRRSLRRFVLAGLLVSNP
jgi:hypothetical protein